MQVVERYKKVYSIKVQIERQSIEKQKIKASQKYLLGGSIIFIGDKASMIIPIEVNTVMQEFKNHF
ncbi:hypothetical protein ACTHOQ_15585 [Solibacillus silvestris]|uniref:hypothetical protein n=1 Tax=Solibacillus silvestris TaxID=76853 RepID=UPI003F7D7F53